MKKSEILREAKKLLASGHEGLICYALWSLAGNNMSKSDRKNIRGLVNWISKLLDGKGTYERWLYINHREFYIRNMRFARVGRMQWIDWMIKYWEGKGK